MLTHVPRESKVETSIVTKDVSRKKKGILPAGCEGRPNNRQKPTALTEATRPAPHPQDGTKRHIGPEETVRKTKRPEILTAVSEVRKRAAP